MIILIIIIGNYLIMGLIPLLMMRGRTRRHDPNANKCLKNACKSNRKLACYYCEEHACSVLNCWAGVEFPTRDKLCYHHYMEAHPEQRSKCCLLL